MTVSQASLEKRETKRNYIYPLPKRNLSCNEITKILEDLIENYSRRQFCKFYRCLLLLLTIEPFLEFIARFIQTGELFALFRYGNGKMEQI